jgi:glycosyltransferase involved in cell wall biosynthesis
VHVRIAADIPFLERGARFEHIRDRKKPGVLRLVFLSRISEKKNLDGTFSMLRDVKGNVLLDIYGPIEDKGYWSICNEIAKDLPDNISITYKGPIAPDEVTSTLAKYDLFVFPTRGENYGHVVAEALVAGTPVLISNRTAFRNLSEKGVGWDLPLESPQYFTEILNRVMEMDADEHAQLVANAMRWGSKLLDSNESIRANRDLFYSLATSS